MQLAEKNAQQKEIGIWGKSLKLMAQSKDAKFQPYQEIKVELTEVVDASSFSVRVLDKSNTYKKIDDAMAKFDADNAEELEKPIKKGTLCATLF